MRLASGLITLFLAAASSEKPAIIVHGENSPVRLDRATVLTGSEGPPVLLYSATNTTDANIDQFTVLAFVFGPDGALKARQIA